MFGTPATASGSALQALPVAAGFLLLGYLVADVLIGPKVDRITKLGLALPGLVAVALAAQGIHLLSGGRLFASAVATRALVIVIFVALFLTRIATRRESGHERTLVIVAISLAFLGVAVWGYPLLRELPLDTGGDTVLLTGYTSQLLNGELLPSGPITGSIPNFYPWMTHSVMALLTHFMPGGRSYHAMPTLQLLQVAGIVLALFALGARLAGERLGRARTGAATALLGAVCGGIGFVALQGIDMVNTPRVNPEVYLGDLLEKRSYNFSFFNIAPAYPRDLAAALLVGFLVALVFGLTYKHTRSLVGAGIVLGLAGVTGGEAFFVGIGVVLVLLLVPVGVSRLQLLATLLPALALYSFWLVPQLIGYLDLGGYVDLTLVKAVTLSPLGILGGWGITTPLAVYGALRAAGRLRTDPGTRVPVVLVAVGAVAVIASSALPAVLGEAFKTLGRAHRYWPLLHLGIALLAAIGFADMVARLLARSRPAAVGLALIVVGVAVTSPMIASIAYARLREPPPLVSHPLRGDSRALLNLIAPETGMRCNVAIGPHLAINTWSYTGYRFVLFRWPGRVENAARIRWRDIYERIPGDEERFAANMILISGADLERWQRIVDRFNVDIVVTRPRAAEGPAMRRFDAELASDRLLSVVRVDDCD